jgi:hypothetical protein
VLFSLLMLAPSAPSSCARPRGRWGRGRGAGLSAAQGGREQTENITTVDQHYLGGEGGGGKDTMQLTRTQLQMQSQTIIPV